MMENTKAVVLWLAFCVSFVISALGNPAGAPPAKPCLAPVQWEGRIVVYDHGTGRNSRSAISYDGENQRIRILEHKKGHVPCKKYVGHTIYDLAKRRRVQIVITTLVSNAKTCFR